MAAILRWFHADGVRHRAYIRRSDAATAELVVAARDWQASKLASRHSLDEYTDDELIRIAHTLRTGARGAGLEAAAG